MQNSLFDRTHARRSLHSAAAPLHKGKPESPTRKAENYQNVSEALAPRLCSAHSMPDTRRDCRSPPPDA